MTFDRERRDGVAVEELRDRLGVGDERGFLGFWTSL